jgi:hypothetical protein
MSAHGQVKLSAGMAKLRCNWLKMSQSQVSPSTDLGHTAVAGSHPMPYDGATTS